MTSSLLTPKAPVKSVGADKAALKATEQGGYILGVAGAIAFMEAFPGRKRISSSLITANDLSPATIGKICDLYLTGGGPNIARDDWRSSRPALLLPASAEVEKCKSLYMTFRHRALKVCPVHAPKGLRALLVGQDEVAAIIFNAKSLDELSHYAGQLNGVNGFSFYVLPAKLASAGDIQGVLSRRLPRAHVSIYSITRHDDSTMLVVVRQSPYMDRFTCTLQVAPMLFERSTCFAKIVEKTPAAASAFDAYPITKTEYLQVSMDFLFPEANLSEAQTLSLSSNGTVKTTGLFTAMLGSVAGIRSYDPSSMCDLPIGSQIMSRPSIISRGATALQNEISGLGFDLQCPPKSLARLDALSAVAELETTPLLPPFGTQLLAYYTPGFRKAEETTRLTIGKRNVVVFETGKEYLILPSFEKQVIEVAPQLVERGTGKVKKRLVERTNIVHNYQRFLCSSELSPSDLTLVHESVKGDETHTIKTGRQDARDKQIRKLQQTLGRTVLASSRQRIEREIQRLQDSAVASENGLLEVSERDPQLINAFLASFPPPKVQTVVEKYPAAVRKYAARAIAAVPSLTPQQLHDVSVASIKDGVIITHAPSAGKTRIAIAIACARKCKRVLYISKAKNIAEAEAEMISLGMPHFRIRSHADIDALKARIASAVKSDLPEFYLVTQEFLALGDLSNQVFDPYKVYFMARPNESDQEPALHCATSRRYNSRIDVQHYLEEHKLSLAKLIPYEYGHHVTWCPKCAEYLLASRNINQDWLELVRDEKGLKWMEHAAETSANNGRPIGHHGNGLWSYSGTCRACGHSARSYVVTNNAQTVEGEEVSEDITDLESLLLGDNTDSNATGPAKKERCSYRQYPAYRRMKSLFDAKIGDEFHNLSSDSLQSTATASIHTRLTIVLSGTLTRKSPEELWKVFSIVFGYDNPRFPYKYSERGAFIDMHVTKSSTTQSVQGTVKQPGKVVKRSTNLVPEPSNTARLWRMLKQAQIHRTEAEVDADLNIPPAVPHVHECAMKGDVLDLYTQVEQGLLEEAADLAAEKNMEFDLRSTGWFAKMSSLAGIGFEAKLPKFFEAITAELADGRKCVVTVKSIRSFERIAEAMKDAKLPFVALDTKTCKADARRDFIETHLVHGDAKILLSRTTLINEALNNLTAASSMFVMEGDYTFHATKQLERRLTRPTQKHKTVNVHTFVSHKGDGLSIDQAMLLVSNRRREANTQLIDGASMFRDSKELVHLATKQRKEQMQVLVELVKNNRKGANFLGSSSETAEAKLCAELSPKKATVAVSTPQVNVFAGPLTSQLLKAAALKRASEAAA